MTVPRLRATGLRVERAGRPVLRDLDIEVHPGEALSVSGSSGCGKSTLLRALALLDPVVGGHIQLDGADGSTIPYREYRRRVSLVFQEPPMFEGTVADNVRFGPGLAGVRLDDREVEDLLRTVSLDPAMGTRDAESLSGGERQRIAIARALANHPDVLLLDEPTSALDPNAAHEVLAQIRRLAERGLAVVAVLHVREHAKLLGGRHLHMVDGHLDVAEIGP